MLEEYHEPWPFRWNLNAFLQAARSVYDLTQKDLIRWARANGRKDEGKAWVNREYDSARSKPLVRRLIDGRDIVVHEGQLTHSSTVYAGWFKNGRIKMTLRIPFPATWPSKDIIDHVREDPQLAKYLTLSPGAYIGEEIGVKRTWHVEELGEPDQDVLELCDVALAGAATFLHQAHKFIGADAGEPPAEYLHTHDSTRVNVLLQTDIDPTLIDSWGWNV